MVPTSNFDESVCETFMKAEDDLLQIDTFFGDPSSTMEYISRFSALAKSAAYGIANNLLSSYTLTLVRRVAFNVTSMANNLRELQSRTKAIESRREAELENLFARLSLKQHPSDACLERTADAAQQNRMPKGITSPSQSGLARSLSEETLVEAVEANDENATCLNHVPLCCEWLKHNMCNPYPSYKVKAEIASKCGIKSEIVGSWFSSTRRRIGWTRLMKRHFRGVRTLAIDYAFRVLQEGNLDSPVPHDIASDFNDMRLKLDEVIDTESGINKTIGTLVDRHSFYKQTTPLHDTKTGDVVSCPERPESSGTIITSENLLTAERARSEAQPSHLMSIPGSDCSKTKRCSKRRRSKSDEAQNDSAKRLCAWKDSPVGDSSPQTADPLPSPSYHRKRRSSSIESKYDLPAKRSRVSSQVFDRGQMSPTEGKDLQNRNDAKSEKHPNLQITGPVVMVQPDIDGDRSSSYEWLWNSGTFTTELCGPGASHSNSLVHTLPECCIDEAFLSSDAMFNSAPSCGHVLAAASDVDPLVMLLSGDFSEDMSGLPLLPDFRIDWPDIAPPSFELSSTSLGCPISTPLLVNSPRLNGTEFPDSPESSPTFTDSSSALPSSISQPSSQSPDERSLLDFIEQGAFQE